MNNGRGKAGIKVSFSWSYKISITDNITEKVVLSSKVMPMSKAVAKKLETYTALNVDIRGKVVRLQRLEEERKGQIIIRGFVKIFEEKRADKVEFPEEEYLQQLKHIMKIN